MVYRKAAVVFMVLFLFALFPGGRAAQAKEPARPELTLDRAAGLALERSRLLQRATLEVEKGYENREEAADQLEFIPVTGGTYSPAVETAWYGLLTADLTWRMSKKQADQQEDALVLDVCQKYWEVQGAEKKLAAARKAAEQAELEARLAQLGYQMGARSQAEVTAAEQKREQARAALAQAEQALEAAYMSFNRLVGLWPEDRPVLVDQVEFSPLEVTDVEHEVARVLAESPSVWLAEQQVTMQGYLQEMMFATGSYRPYRVRQIEKEQAELSASEAKDATAQAVRSLYARVRSLEEGYRQAEAQVAQAREAVRLARLRYEVGMATRVEVQTAEVALAQAETAADDVLRQHAYYKLAFQKPWAVGGA